MEETPSPPDSPEIQRPFVQQQHGNFYHKQKLQQHQQAWLSGSHTVYPTTEYHQQKPFQQRRFLKSDSGFEPSQCSPKDLDSTLTGLTHGNQYEVPYSHLLLPKRTVLVDEGNSYLPHAFHTQQQQQHTLPTMSGTMDGYSSGSRGVYQPLQGVRRPAQQQQQQRLPKNHYLSDYESQ